MTFLLVLILAGVVAYLGGLVRKLQHQSALQQYQIDHLTLKVNKLSAPNRSFPNQFWKQNLRKYLNRSRKSLRRFRSSRRGLSRQKSHRSLLLNLTTLRPAQREPRKSKCQQRRRNRGRNSIGSNSSARKCSRGLAVWRCSLASRFS